MTCKRSSNNRSWLAGVATSRASVCMNRQRESAKIIRIFMTAQMKTAAASGCFQINFGVADGARTHDNWNHNPGLYQLSYSHLWYC